MMGAWFVDVPGGINGFWNRMLYGHPSHYMGEPTFPSWYRLLNGVNFWVTCCGVEGRLELPHIFYTLCFWKHTAFTLSPRHIIIVTIASDWVVKHSDIIKYVSLDLTYQCNNHSITSFGVLNFKVFLGLLFSWVAIYPAPACNIGQGMSFWGETVVSDHWYSRPCPVARDFEELGNKISLQYWQ